MPAVSLPDPCCAAVPHKAVIHTGDKLCPGAVEQTEFPVTADNRAAIQQRCGPGKDPRLVGVAVGPVHAVVAEGSHFVARCIQIHPFAVPLCGGQRRVKKEICCTVNKSVRSCGVSVSINILLAANVVEPAVPLGLQRTVPDRHKAVGAAAEQQHVRISRCSQLTRAKGAVVDMQSVIL